MLVVNTPPLKLAISSERAKIITCQFDRHVGTTRNLVSARYRVATRYYLNLTNLYILNLSLMSSAILSMERILMPRIYRST